MRVDGDWRSVEAIEKQLAEEGRVAQYRQVRQQLAGTLAGEVSLARWCRRQRLFDQEKLHWAAVLRFDRNHGEARGRLALREYRGMLLTKEQIVQHKAYLEAYEMATKEWESRVERWRKAITGQDVEARERALVELRAVADPAAVSTLETMLSIKSEELALEVVAVLGQIKEQESTDSLIRHAVLAESEQVRQKATEALTQRTWISCVPSLLGGLEEPLEYRFSVANINGAASRTISIASERPGAETHFVRGDQYVGVALPGEGLRSLIQAPLAARVVASIAARRMWIEAMNLRDAVQERNQASEAVNQRAFTVLKQVTRQQLPDRPQDWWKWWQQYNGIPEGKQATTLRQDYARFQRYNGHSCFLRGTIVWTETGGVPIEQVRAGDRVLSQDQDTGELAYKLVLERTLRPPTSVLRIGLDDEELAITPGHPMWVVGKGWRMAKEVTIEDRLHGMHGAVEIDYIKPGPEDEAYNLVVADFNTYFVGKQRVLVHDNLFRSNTDTVIPGYAKH
ncbi:MAG: polymorphic toxin-type HINT domain-containing protein [Planctomycetota bacterium]|nr:polymorphic toxin-type HINT domain-containing protein [Planctomycetota bacterium]